MRARARRALAWFALATALGCGGRGGGGRRSDGGVAVDAAPAVVAVALRPLGKATLDEYGWRAGPGAAAFARSLAAERGGDLAGVEREAAAALAADPGHLEAAWLVAIARARLGRPGEVLAPLEIAAAGDWSKWGERSLELAALADFRGTPAGRGWVAAAEGYRAALAATVADAVIVVGARAGRGAAVGRELYAVDPAGPRWIRLTRSGGAVIGALPAPGAPLVAYVTATRAGRRDGPRELKVGVVDLTTGRASREVAIADGRGLVLAWRASASGPALEVQVPGQRGKVSGFAIDWRHARRAPIAKPARIRGDRLEIGASAVVRRRLPIAGITADWDDGGTASAVRIERSGKVVTEPGGGLIDGESAALSPDRARLVFVTALEPPCDDADARRLVVAEVATGRVRALAAGQVTAPIWVDADRVAFVDGAAVKVVAVASGKVVATIAGGAGVTTTAPGPRRRCDAAPTPFADAVVVAAEDDDVDFADDPVDAGAGQPPHDDGDAAGPDAGAPALAPVPAP
ncbi:MAG: hypothetical protein IPL61_02540 [Myxococcales bacterium]|nr:hypothetical protein [Myxococcales bacterium]